MVQSGEIEAPKIFVVVFNTAPEFGHWMQKGGCELVVEVSSSSWKGPTHTVRHTTTRAGARLTSSQASWVWVS